MARSAGVAWVEDTKRQTANPMRKMSKVLLWWSCFHIHEASTANRRLCSIHDPSHISPFVTYLELLSIQFFKGSIRQILNDTAGCLKSGSVPQETTALTLFELAMARQIISRTGDPQIRAPHNVRYDSVMTWLTIQSTDYGVQL